MSNQDSTREPRARKRRLPREQSGARQELATLFDYEEGEWIRRRRSFMLRGNRQSITHHLKKLCAGAGVEIRQHLSEAYRAAILEALTRREAGEDVSELMRHDAAIRKTLAGVYRRAQAADEERRTAPAPEPEGGGYLITMERAGAGNIGYARGECLTTDEARDIRAGEPCAAWAGEDDRATVGRVVAADSQTITIQDEDGAAHTFDRRGAAYIGRVTGACEDLTAEEAARVGELRARLEKLYEPENEAARFACEREIYAIERAARAPAPEEWPDTLEEKGGARA